MMTEDTICVAPQVKITEAIYEAWMVDHTGTKDDFLRFLTMPSCDRDAFLKRIYCETEIAEGLGITTYNA